MPGDSGSDPLVSELRAQEVSLETVFLELTQNRPDEMKP